MTNTKTKHNQPNQPYKTVSLDLSTTKCARCGRDADLMVAFTAHKICGRCTRELHKEAIKTK